MSNNIDLTGTERTPIYQDLIESAMESETPVTDIKEVSDYRTIYRAAHYHDGAVWRADIDTVDERDEFDSTPSVSFAKCHPESDAWVMRDWTSLATGRLSGPNTLAAWESLFTVFNVALGLYNREVRDGAGSDE